MSAIDFTPLESRIDPASAADRAELFSHRLAVAREIARLATVEGRERETHNDPAYYYERVLRAQLDFAEVQVRARKSAQSQQEPAASEGGRDA